MAKSKIDELNILSSSDEEEFEESFDYHDYIAHYFDTMQISEKQRKERIDTAEEIFDAILLFFIWCENAPERVEEEETLHSFENMYKEVIFQHGKPDDFFDTYVALFIPLLIATTLAHLGEPYFTSVERAANVAVNESNTVVNHAELQHAIEDGYNYKQWHTELDERVRLTHQELEGAIVPINDPFHVGAYLMMQPHDISLGAGLEEVANCRCIISYKKDFIDYDLQFFADKSKHEQYRQKQRHITEEDIQNALDYPLDDPYNYFEDDELGGKIKFIGEKVTVVVNAENGNQITCFETPPYLVKRLKNDI